jgi:hypothetical protein
VIFSGFIGGNRWFLHRNGGKMSENGRKMSEIGGFENLKKNIF